MSPVPESSQHSWLTHISTRWPLISDPVQFVLRYAPAVRRYLRALVPNEADADDVSQDFLTHLVEHPFLPEQVRHGRFREYLKAVLRNFAMTHYRRQPSPSTGGNAIIAEFPGPDETVAAEEAWVAEWRACLLDRALERLASAERRGRETYVHTVLVIQRDYSNEDSTALAARLSSLVGRPISASAYRKQLSRARRELARQIIDEVKQTLDEASAERIVEELCDLRLMELVRDFLPEPWRSRG